MGKLFWIVKAGPMQSQVSFKSGKKRQKSVPEKHILNKTKLVTAGFHNTEAPKAKEDCQLL